MRRVIMVIAVALCVPSSVQAQIRATGGVLLPPAEYAALPVVPRYRAFLPPMVDLSRWFPEAGDQGGQPSCTAWATGYALRSYYENRLATASLPASTPLSPSFVYNLLTEPRGVCRSGISIPSALSLLRQNGVPPLAEFSYAFGSCDSQPSPEVKDSASRYRIRGWERLDISKLDDLKGQVANGNPVVVALRLPTSFFGASGTATFDDIDAKSWVHAMVAVAYDDRRAAFRLINSWGPGWGDHGFVWVSYRAMSALTAEAYAVSLDRPVPPLYADETPPPQPLPEPQPSPEPKPKPKPVVVTPPPAPTPPPTPPRPVLADVEASVRHLAGGLQCAKVETSAKSGVLTVRGFVATTDDRDKLVKVVGEGGHGWRPHLDLTVEPWPHCEARLTLAEALAQPGGLLVSIKGKPALTAGESLAIEVVTPDYPSHLYVTYIQADGQVAHLRRYGDAGWKPVPANTRLTLGGAGEWRISGPAFGRESVVVVASALPLLALDRPPVETERDYLSQLRLGLLAQQSVKGRRAVSAAVAPLTTSAQ
ncbi:conserved exported hypothetical protein [Candidatus Terasakiella magnetica]|nr:conserved exported hypothetical protein [Candidatus Terasakiella magnetica]